MRENKDPGWYMFSATWLGSEVQKCSWAAKGLWIDCLCHMQQSNPEGVLPGTPEGLAEVFGLRGEVARAWWREVGDLVAELERAKVFSRGRKIDGALEPDAIINRRMYREWCKHHARSERAQRAAIVRHKRARGETGVVEIGQVMVRQALLERVMRASGDGPEWRDWWMGAIEAMDRAQALHVIEDAARAIEDARDPETARAKGLVMPNEPGKVMCVDVLTFAKTRRLRLPEMPGRSAS